ncbi:MAG TPA: hypothetical protein VIM75_01250 [Ohtaekwangia sp.]|uniref:hypothetical protein n=1 Tax=Ohtaekwangia sp. TaxID=2066019 RepID=UPI002F93401E
MKDLIKAETLLCRQRAQQGFSFIIRASALLPMSTLKLPREFDRLHGSKKNSRSKSVQAA